MRGVERSSSFVRFLLLLLAAAGASACPGSQAEKCGESICQSGLVCEEIHEVCVLPIQLDLCVGYDDGDPCQVPGSSGAYVCDQEVCLFSFCGDGILDRNTGEQCDDGNTNDEDDCRNDCVLRTCGDHILDPGEECDGERLDGQTCASLGFDTGELACGYNCRFDTTGCITQCGNGIVGSSEECDDGNAEGGDGCSSFCVIEAGWECSETNPSVCTRCGDSKALLSELCDGDDLLGQTCVSQGFDGGDLACLDTCDAFDTSDCYACGDGVCNVVETEESCPQDCGLVAIAGGGSHTCAMKGTGDLFCWGYNGLGQIGDGTTVDRSVPVQVAGLDAVAIAAGQDHTCAVLSDGTTACWGYNYWGQLGNGTGGESTDASAPVPVSNLTNAVSIASGERHTCAVTSNGTAFCWGNNSDGQLGDGTGINSYTPVQVGGLSDLVAVSAGNLHTCAVKSDGTAWCWGLNSFGQLGDGTQVNSSSPVQVSSLADAVAIDAGFEHTCALISDGTARCWGHNTFGELGNGANLESLVPVQVSGLVDAVAVAADFRHSCASSSSGSAWCWGYNIRGQLGDGTTDNSSLPVQVSNLTDVKAVTNGDFHSCAIESDGTAYCWGYNNSGQLGDGTSTYIPSLTPVQVLMP